MKISQTQLEYFAKLASQHPGQALKELQASESSHADDPTFWFNYAGWLIDCGGVLRQRTAVERGIRILEDMVPKAHEPVLPNLLYDLGNGYSALYDLARQQPEFRYDPDDQALSQAKRYYREALAHSDRIPTQLRSMIRVNYGNCLAHLGRSAEAIDSYDLALLDLPKHAMALGNLGLELTRYVNIARDPSLLVNARDLLREALIGPNLEETGSASARSTFEKTLRTVEERLSVLGTIQPHTHEHHAAEVGSERDAAYLHSYIAFCRQHHLFLNLCLRNRPCVHPARDTVSLALATAIGDDVTFYRLSRIINEIKERYAVSRMLLFEACDPPIDAQHLDVLTLYTDNLDYAVYGIRVSKLKLAFEGAYNVLDKIAFFVNDYLAIGVRERDVSFSSIWRERKSNTFRSSLVKLNNWYLFGLYDVSRDLAAGDYFGHLSKLRHYSTHRYLVPHIEAIEWRTEADAEEYHLGYHELFEKTLELLQLVRSAVTYLIALIDAEERRKRRNLPGLTIPMHMPAAQTYPLGPQDSGV